MLESDVHSLFAHLPCWHYAYLKLEFMRRALNSSQVLSESVGTPKKYRCVFLHGIGYLVTGPPNASDVEGYWGGDEIVRQNTPQCSSWTFVHQDTVHRAWNDTSLVACGLAMLQSTAQTRQSWTP